MSDTVISVQNLSKRYIIGHEMAQGEGLRHAFEKAIRSPFRWLRSRNEQRRASKEEFWALRNVDLEVKRGDVLGIIGRNGAGKSTMLKILSRITAPTEGRIRIVGNVASLLEVGTGFHPELTGRENIFLNGSILGMRRTEIRRKFDEIVEFSGVEKFLDTPVKRYSSGMYVRLAFAVAAHLEPEILIIDEVLAVGDVAFQKKCLGKMDQVARNGRTILFVSHNMAAVENLCRRGVVLRSGRVEFVGSQSESIREYLRGTEDTPDDLRLRTDRAGSGDVKVVGYSIRDAKGHEVDLVVSGQDIEVWLNFETREGVAAERIVASLDVRTHLGVPVFMSHNRMTGNAFDVLPSRGVFRCQLRRLPLPPASYRVGFSVMNENGRGGFTDHIEHAFDLTVAEGDYFGSGEVPPPSHGLCLVDGAWSLVDA